MENAGIAGIDRMSLPARRVRVAHLSSPRTSGTLTAKYAQALVDAGAEVCIFSHSTTREAQFRQGLIPTSAPVVILPFGKRALARSEYYSGRSRLRKMAAEVIIAEDPELLDVAAKYARASAARLVYMPFEYYPGAAYATPVLERRWERLENKNAQEVASWILPGDKIADLYAGALAQADTVHVVYNGSPLAPNGSVPKLRRALGLGSEARVILYQGGVHERRGIWDVLSAMPLLPSHIHFAVLGDGELDRLRQDAAARGLSGRVHVLDAVPQAELTNYTMDADVGLIPIHNTCVSYDLCSPGKLFEYLGAGLPVVVSRLAQLEWFVTRNGLGEVFDLGAPAALARAVLRLLDDELHRDACRSRVRKLQDTAVCWELQAERLRRAVLGPYYGE
jgi:glycosyltransferase involved in cell wall biosynthesis